MLKEVKTEIKVGIFVSFGMSLILLAVLLLGGNQSFYIRQNSYTAHFSRVDGLITGARVILGGVPVGIVDSIHFDKSTRNVVVEFSIDKSAEDLIRTDSTIQIATQGVLGDKYLSIELGSENQTVLLSGADIPVRASHDIAQFLTKGDQLMISLNSIALNLDKILKTFETENRSEIFFKNMASTAKNLSEMSSKLGHELDQIQIKNSMGNLNQIFEKINNGTGTLGALINDPTLYDEVTALMGGANRNRIIRNLVRQTIKDSQEANPNPPANRQR